MKKGTKTTKKTAKRKAPPRTTRKFQLRKDHPVDQHVAEILDYQRTQSKEVTTIRDGVRLYWALLNGDLDEVVKIFPQYRGKLGGGGDDLKQQLSRIEQLMLTQGGEDIPDTSDDYPKMKKAGAKPLNAPTFAMPVFEDDDEPTVLIRADTKTDSAANFVNALKNMQ